MNGADDPEELTPAEHALREQLQVLQGDPPSATLTSGIIRAARWQRSLRRPVLAIGSVGGAIIDGIRLLFGSSKRS
ncbi:MAG: hypothetical protein WAL63_21920 [Solirubrobacteraceae bacterium]